MPEYTFTGLVPHEFPEERHADGTPVRSVEPGEIRDLPRAIDHQWRETADEDRAAWAAILAARAGGAGEEAADGQAAAAARPETAAPQPAKPSRKTAVSASEAGTAGGSEG